MTDRIRDHLKPVEERSSQRTLPLRKKLHTALVALEVLTLLSLKRPDSAQAASPSTAYGQSVEPNTPNPRLPEGSVNSGPNQAPLVQKPAENTPSVQVETTQNPLNRDTPLPLIRGKETTTGLITRRDSGILTLSLDPNQWYLGDEEAGAAHIASSWQYSTGLYPNKQPVLAALLDCGAVPTADLKNKLILSRDFTNSQTGPNRDACDHATHLAEIITANHDDGVGITGAAYDTRLLNGKVIGDNGYATIGTVADGIVWAADNGAKAINLSVGAPVACPKIIQDAIDYAWIKGALTIVAAGNEAGPLDTPANCNRVLAVGASDRTGAIWTYSSRPDNNSVNNFILAPGVDVYSGNNSNIYFGVSGTSEAAPFGTALAAQLAAEPGYDNPQARLDLILARNRNKVVNFYDTFRGLPLLNPAPPAPPPEGCNPNNLVEVKVQRIPNGLDFTITDNRGNINGVNINKGNPLPQGFSIELKQNNPTSREYWLQTSSEKPYAIDLEITDPCPNPWGTFIGDGTPRIAAP